MTCTLEVEAEAVVVLSITKYNQVHRWTVGGARRMDSRHAIGDRWASGRVVDESLLFARYEVGRY